MEWKDQHRDIIAQKEVGCAWENPVSQDPRKNLLEIPSKCNISNEGQISALIRGNEDQTFDCELGDDKRLEHKLDRSELAKLLDKTLSLTGFIALIFLPKNA